MSKPENLYQRLRRQHQEKQDANAQIVTLEERLQMGKYAPRDELRDRFKKSEERQ